VHYRFAKTIPDLASPEYHEGIFVIAGDEALGAVFIKKDNIFQPCFLEPACDKIFSPIKDSIKFADYYIMDKTKRIKRGEVDS
jgi:hypothetical protein